MAWVTVVRLAAVVTVRAETEETAAAGVKLVAARDWVVGGREAAPVVLLGRGVMVPATMEKAAPVEMLMVAAVPKVDAVAALTVDMEANW